MAKETKSTIMVAVISAISAIVIAVITTYGTIAVSAPEAQKVKEELKDISDLRLIKNLPIGTIVPSMLRPTEFTKAVGDLERGTIEWVLADGQKDITNSRYGYLSGKTKPPDLRGVFLRGLNEGRNDGKQDPNNSRVAGDYQLDAFKSHNHIILGRRFEHGGEKKIDWYFKEDKLENPCTKDSNFLTDYQGGDETRPKNVAVYFYIKIN